MFYTDIHSHILCGTDDGATDETEMRAMLDCAYADGVRTLCLTPHYQPAFYGENTHAADIAFARLSAYAAEKYPDMSLSLGNELGYHTECRSAVEAGRCRLLGGEYLLTDFMPDVTVFQMRYAMDELLSAGYSVILAHVERYMALYGEEDLLLDWTRRGALLQMNASAFSKKLPLRVRSHVRRLMRRVPIHLVASDAHNLTTRPPRLSAAEEMISTQYGSDAARMLLSYGPSQVVLGKKLV